MRAGRWRHSVCIECFPQAVGPPQDLALASSREPTPVGDMLFLRRKAQRRHSYEKRPTQSRAALRRRSDFKSSPLRALPWEGSLSCWAIRSVGTSHAALGQGGNLELRGFCGQTSSLVASLA
jgi:hypothetical protein